MCIAWNVDHWLGPCIVCWPELLWNTVIIKTDTAYKIRVSNFKTTYSDLLQAVTYAVCCLEICMQYQVGVVFYSKHSCPYIVGVPKPTYFFHRSLKISWVWSHSKSMVCKKTTLPLEKVWITPYLWHTAHKISSQIWVCSNPQCTIRKVSSLKHGYDHTHDIWPGIVQLCCLFTF